MSLHVNEEFLQFTDDLIKHVSQYDLKTLNGDILIAKPVPPKVTKGGLIVDAGYNRRMNYYSGFGRIIMLPSTPFTTTEGHLPTDSNLSVGDFIVFTHNGRYKPAPSLLNFMLDYQAEDEEVMDNYNSEYEDIGALFLVPQQEVRMVRESNSILRQIRNI